MSNFKKIVRNYREILPIVGLPEDLADVSRNDDALESIQKDLPRSCFVDFNGRTTASLHETWGRADVSHAYSQGNITASVFSLEWILFVLGSPRFIREDPMRTEDDRMLVYAQKQNLSFAYYGDDGLPCGFCLSYSEKDPSLWTVSIIHNTTAAPEERTVTTFCAEEMVEHPGDVQLTGNTVFADILQATNSTGIQLLLKDIIDPTGQVNLDELRQLQERIKAHQNIDNRDVKQVQLNELIERERAYYPDRGDLQDLFEGIKQRAATDIHFFKDEHFANVLQSIPRMGLQHSINQFERRLQALDESATTSDQRNFHRKGVALLNEIKTAAGTEPILLSAQDLSDLKCVLKCASIALEDPKDGQNIRELGKPSQTVSGKSSSFWKGLGAALLAFTGAALVVAGVLGAIPSGGVSLALVVAGAAALTSAGSALIAHGSEYGLAKSVSNFKSAMNEIKPDDVKDGPIPKPR